MSQHFEIIDEQEIKEINSLARRYRHITTGAEVLSMINDDENKVFGITFRTPPPDSTGLPHIMEHSVLSGSRKYPVKEPHLELIKSSLKTYANALTFPDRTSYPCASQNLADFYNLVDVYLDSVFYPLLPNRILDQEGWHLELNDPDAPLSYKGVVYNEMKGVYSDPQNFLGRMIRSSLFPDTPYQHDSGGNPTEIPDLTYENFLRFHEIYYHPSNSLIFFSGDDPPEQRLELLQEYLKDFEPGEDLPGITLQEPFAAPIHVTEKFAVGEENGAQERGFVSVNWLLPENDNLEQSIALEVLGHALLGTQGSPLRKTMIDSGLGEDLVHSGFADSLRQMFFSAGLKGVPLADLDRVEPMILEALEDLSTNGIDKGAVLASVNTLEFYLRERNSGGYPRGLVVMFQALSPWIFGRDPLEWLQYEGPLSSFKENLENSPQYLENLLRSSVLENRHRLTVYLVPDSDLQAARRTEETERLVAIKNSFSEEEITGVISQSRRLKEFQETPDTPEALAAIPTLQLSDLDKENKLIPCNIEDLKGVELITHDLFTDGIAYLDLAFDLKTIPIADLSYLPLYRRALLEMGTQKEDYVRLSQRIGQQTGGVSSRFFTSDILSQNNSAGWMIMRSKAVTEKSAEMSAILDDILLLPNFKDRDRFEQILVKEKAALEASLVRAGRTVADRRLRSRYSQSAWVNEQISGIDYLFFIRDLVEKFDESWEEISDKLETIHKKLINAHELKVNLTLPAHDVPAIKEQLQPLIEKLTSHPQDRTEWKTSSDRFPEGLIIPTQVNYVGKAAPLYDFGYSYNGSIQVILNYLRTTWLWDKIRIQGGAYGVSASFGRQSGVLTLASYRDPNLLDSLSVYDGSAEFLKSSEINSDEIRKSIIGAIGTLDAYRLPDAKGYVSLIWHLIGESDETRQLIRDQVLGTSLKDFLDFSDVMNEFRANGTVAAVGSLEAFEAAQDENPDYFSLTTIL